MINIINKKSWRKKIKKKLCSRLIIQNTVGSSFKSWSLLGLCPTITLMMTKGIDDISTWQDSLFVDFAVDLFVLNLQNKYNW